MRIVKSIDDLTRELIDVNNAGAISDAARRRQFTTFQMELPDDFPSDPDSEAYRQRQFHLYREIAGRDYAASNERTHFDALSMADRPFPYLNEGWEVTGDQLIAVGWLFKVMQLAPKSAILEFGPGWGNSTLALAQNGYQVTAIEIEPNFVDLIQERARRSNVAVDVRRGDFFDAEALGRTFDAVLFFECFHHCADHNRLFRLLPTLLNDDGIAVFCAEPIDESFKYPWSVRLDGQSLWAIRENGWLELGFTESYFMQKAMECGLLVNRRACLQASPLANCLVARKAKRRYDLGTFDLPPVEDRTWSSPETDSSLRQRFTTDRSVITLERRGSYATIEVALRNYAPFPLPVQLTFGGGSVSEEIPPHSERVSSLPYDPDGSQLVVGTRAWRPADWKGMAPDMRYLGVAVQSITLR